MEKRITAQQIVSSERRDRMLETERDLLLLSGVDPEFVRSADLFIDDAEYIHYNEVFKCPKNISKKRNNVLILLHGYGAFGATNFKLVSELCDYFYIVLVDLPGFGFSFKSAATPYDSIDTCITYFVTRLKAFVDKLGLPRFCLAGHSLGAYLAAHFFREHHKMVRKLFLLSPAGMNLPSEDQLQRFLKIVGEKGGWLAKTISPTILRRVFEHKTSPFELIPQTLRPLVIKLYLKNKRFSFSSRERHLIHSLQNYFALLPQCGEKCVGYIFHYGPKSHKPIIDILAEKRNLARSVVIFFGEFDTMDKELTKAMLKSRKLDIKVVTVKDADHQVLFQRCDEIAKQIVDTSKATKAKPQSHN